jgi:hypothetical protein
LFTAIYDYQRLTKRNLAPHALFKIQGMGAVGARPGGRLQLLLTIHGEARFRLSPRSIGMRRPTQTLLIAAFALAASAGVALASGALDVPLNESVRVPLHGTAANVVIGDPSVADVSMSDAHSVILLGKGYGSTRLTVTDARGRTLLASLVSVVEPDEGHITYYKGVEPHQYVCGGARCEELHAGASGGGAAPAPMVSNAGPSATAPGTPSGEAGAAAAANQP